MVAKLAERTDKADKLLQEIAKNVQEGKKTRLDPALSDEVKKLLRCVRLSFPIRIRLTCILFQRCPNGRRRACQRLSRSAYERGKSFLLRAGGNCVTEDFACSCAQIQRMFKEVGLLFRLYTEWS